MCALRLSYNLKPRMNTPANMQCPKIGSSVVWEFDSGLRKIDFFFGEMKIGMLLCLMFKVEGLAISGELSRFSRPVFISSFLC